MNNIAAPTTRTVEQATAVQARGPYVGRRDDSLASAVALACVVLCLLFALAVAVSAISFYNQQAIFLHTRAHKTSRTAPSVRSRAHVATQSPYSRTPERPNPYVRTAAAKTSTMTAAEDYADIIDR